MTRSDPITRAVERNLCTGCGGCAGLKPAAIRMVEHPVHGRRPVVAPTAEGRAAARAVASVCAGTGADHRALPRVDDIDREWGPVLAVWQGWAADPEMTRSLCNITFGFTQRPLNQYTF